MTNRRKFIAGVGALATGSAAAVGTGAFSNTQANRSVGLSVEGDRDAYLGLESTSEYTSYSDDTDGVLEIDFGAETAAGGSGLNQDAVVSFKNIFKITNQGTRTIAVWFDDGRADISAGDQYWSEGNFNQKVEEQLTDGAGHAENYYNFSTDDGDDDGLNSFPVEDIAPTNIDTEEFTNPDVNGVILEAGDSATVNAYFGNTEDFKPGDITDAQITIWAYSQEYAENAQE